MMSVLPDRRANTEPATDVNSRRSLGLVRDVTPSSAPAATATDVMPGARPGVEEELDELWSILTRCLVLREGLEQACNETQTALDSIQSRLDALDLDSISADAGVRTSRS